MPSPRRFIAGPSGSVPNYLAAFTSLGAACETLPRALPEKLQYKDAEPASSDPIHYADRCASSFDALILPGGGDIDPALFHQKDQGSRTIDPALDRLQLRFLRAFLEKGRPVLGICKGMQLINVFFGGGIIQDLPTGRQHEYIGKDQVHPTTAQKGSLLHSLYGESFPVNSAHHQGISEPGEGLTIIQHAPDGVPEAVIHSNLPLIGVQWHPERMCFSHSRTDTPDGRLLLAHFLSLCRPVSDASRLKAENGLCRTLHSAPSITSDQSEIPI